ncbi:non-heme iron oxygenase ferredoxin subunit [Bradyrhizobium sp. RDT10]
MIQTENRNLAAICNASEVIDGEIKGAELPNGERIALYRYREKIYATSDICTHGEASLSEEGLLTGNIVECTWHFGTFDVTTGRAETSPCTVPLKTYPVQIIDGMIYVEF